MQTKDLGLLALGSFFILLGSALASGFGFAGTEALNSLLTFFVAFLLVFMGGVLWIATAVNVLKEM
jgi:hypothetical protein